MTDRHSISEPRAILSSDIPAWEVDVFRDNVATPVDTILITNDTLPPRVNKKGKVVWKLPCDFERLPKFGSDECRRILELFRDRKKKRKKGLLKTESLRKNTSASVNASGTESGNDSENDTDGKGGAPPAEPELIQESNTPKVFGKKKNKHVDGAQENLSTKQKSVVLDGVNEKTGLDPPPPLKPLAVQYPVSAPVTKEDRETSNNSVLVPAPPGLSGLSAHPPGFKPNGSLKRVSSERIAEAAAERIAESAAQNRMVKPDLNIRSKSLGESAKSENFPTLPKNERSKALQEAQPRPREPTPPIRRSQSQLESFPALPQNERSLGLQSQRATEPSPQSRSKSSNQRMLGSSHPESFPSLPKKTTAQMPHSPMKPDPRARPQAKQVQSPKYPQKYISIDPPPTVDSPVSISLAKQFLSLYYPLLSSPSPLDLLPYYTPGAQKSISIGGAHSVVTGRNGISTQLQSLSRSLFVVRGVVAQDLYPETAGGGVLILITGLVHTTIRNESDANVAAGMVYSCPFAHSVTLVKMKAPVDATCSANPDENNTGGGALSAAESEQADQNFSSKFSKASAGFLHAISKPLNNSPPNADASSLQQESPNEPPPVNNTVDGYQIHNDAFSLLSGDAYHVNSPPPANTNPAANATHPSPYHAPTDSSLYQPPPTSDRSHANPDTQGVYRHPHADHPVTNIAPPRSRSDGHINNSHANTEQGGSEVGGNLLSPPPGLFG